MKELKKRIYLFVFCLVAVIFMAIGLASGQNIYIADNNFNAPTGAHIFPTIQAAVDAASAGDIVQVQPSPTTYGDAIISKQITLVGIGFNVIKDIPLESKMTNITLTNNSDNTSDASGTTIMGLRINNVYLGALTGASFTLQNVTVYNCIVYSVYGTSSYAPIDGLTIEDCYIFSSIASNSSIYLAQPVNSSVIHNNLIVWNINFGSGTPGINTITNNLIYRHISISAEGSNTNIINNVFAGAAGTTYAFETLRDCIVAYNIFYGVTPSAAAAGTTSTNFQRNVFTFNLVHSSGDNSWPPAGGGSGNSGSPNYVGSPLFANVQLLSTWSSLYDFTLNPGSPALLANIPVPDGAITDIGFTGGSYPWTESNMTFQTTALPVIEILNTTTIINPGDNLPVHIKATSY